MPVLSLVDLESIMIRGDAPRVALLRYCVKAVTMEPLFVFLAQQYAFRPTHAAALALYDVFCAPDALARVKALRALPPRNLRLSATIARLRQEQDDLQAADAESVPLVRLTAPYRNLFDVVVGALRDDPSGPLAATARNYDPSLGPIENLPGGTLTAGQRYFVDNVWRPRLRPQLVAAGFWQVGTID